MHIYMYIHTYVHVIFVYRHLYIYTYVHIDTHTYISTPAVRKADELKSRDFFASLHVDLAGVDLRFARLRFAPRHAAAARLVKDNSRWVLQILNGYSHKREAYVHLI